MTMRVRGFFAVWMTAIFIGPGVAPAAEIRVLSDGPLALALTRVADSFKRDKGHEVTFVFGLSPVIHKKVIDGESGDVVIIQPNFVDELVKAGKVVAGQLPIIGRIGIGLFGRSDVPSEDTSTPEALKQVLLKTDTLVFNNVASGNAFAKILDQLSITEEIKSKITRTTPADVIVRILQGRGNDIGVYPVSLIIADKRLKLIGVLPSEFQSYIAYTAVPMVNSQSRELANEFIHFLGLPETKKEFAAAGVN
jgi:molybdate transport system substrate-binding protein